MWKRLREQRESRRAHAFARAFACCTSHTLKTTAGQARDRIQCELEYKAGGSERGAWLFKETGHTWDNREHNGVEAGANRHGHHRREEGLRDDRPQVLGRGDGGHGLREARGEQRPDVEQLEGTDDGVEHFHRGDAALAERHEHDADVERAEAEAVRDVAPLGLAVERRVANIHEEIGCKGAHGLRQLRAECALGQQEVRYDPADLVLGIRGAEAILGGREGSRLLRTTGTWNVRERWRLSAPRCAGGLLAAALLP